MSRDYILRESATQRKALIEAVMGSALRVIPYSGPGAGVTISLGFDAGDYRTQLLEKLQAGLPLSDIPELETWMREMQPKIEEMERERREWREVGIYRTSVKNFATEILGQSAAPAESHCEQLIATIKECPLIKESPATLDDIRGVCSRHPWLNFTISLLVGHLRFVELAPQEQRPYFIDRMWKAWAKQKPQKSEKPKRKSSVEDPPINDSDAFDYDDPPIVFFKNMEFIFSGKFKYGKRKACGEAVARLGGGVVETANRWVDYLVVASGGDNTSPTSSSCGPILNWRARGWPCFVISEELWVRSLASAA